VEAEELRQAGRQARRGLQRRRERLKATATSEHRDVGHCCDAEANRKAKAPLCGSRLAPDARCHTRWTGAPVPTDCCPPACSQAEISVSSCSEGRRPEDRTRGARDRQPAHKSVFTLRSPPPPSSVPSLASVCLCFAPLFEGRDQRKDHKMQARNAQRAQGWARGTGGCQAEEHACGCIPLP
jgi:hypothetical protein